MKYFMKNCFLVCLIFLISTNLKAENFNFLNTFRINQGARLASVGGAFIADIYEPGIMFFNPAGLSYLKYYSIKLNHYQEISINGYSECIIFPVNLSKFEVISFSINALHTGYFTRNELPQLKFVQIGYNIAYARELLNYLSVGAIFGFQYAKSNYNDLWTYRSLVGLFYIPSEHISYSFTIGEFGNGIKYTLTDKETILRNINLPNGMQLGMTMRYPLNLRDHLFAISLSSEKIFNETGQRYKAGFEIYPIRFIAFRAGYFVSDYLRYPTFGGGIIIRNFILDFAFYPNKLTNREFYISLSYRLVN